MSMSDDLLDAYKRETAERERVMQMQIDTLRQCIESLTVSMEAQSKLIATLLNRPVRAVRYNTDVVSKTHMPYPTPFSKL